MSNYKLKIELQDVMPKVWRRFVVPSHITLDRLHDVIQIVMEWTDSHLHEFTIHGGSYSDYQSYEFRSTPSGDYRLSEFGFKKGDAFSYLYDFGDYWMHKVTIESIRCRAPKSGYSIECQEGSNACPPEDVGGAPGYERFLTALKDTTHEDHELYLSWNGESFDSKLIQLDGINENLAKYERWSRDRRQRWG